MKDIFFTDLYINAILLFYILFFSISISIYILLNDEYNTILRIISIIIIFSSIYLFLQKETFLPFLGTTFIPNNLFDGEKYPEGSNLNYTINMSDYDDGTKVIYWASNNTGKIIQNPYDAYKDFHNSGIAIVKKGKAEIRIYCPDKYKVKNMYLLKKHFHYRIIDNKKGFVSPVQTFYVDC